MSFSQALSGLNAQQEKLGAIGNNIANSQTVGFKSSNVQFADVFAESKIGLGTKVSTVLQNFGQGNVESSSRNMDLAISGEGFFRFQQPGGEVGYSRNGQLTLTADGELVNAQGARIMGYGADAEGNIQAGGNVEALSIDAGDMEAKATTSLGINLNLNSGEKGLDTAKFDSSDSETYSFSTNATVYDSQGNARNLNMYFIKDKDGSNKWEIKGKVSGGPDDAKVYEVDDLGSLEFNKDGTLDKYDSAALKLDDKEFASSGGSFEELNVELSFSKASQFAKDSTVDDITQGGHAAGSLVGTTIEDDGTIVRNYSNEESRAAGQIALADFRNPEGLKPEGDNLWSATGASGQELVGTPGSGQRGLIEPGAIETSNVDMGEELVDMIVSQRAYQANSQTITTQDELLQTIINM
ncbi:flagellar hook protein FlgE [Vreelandella jeotgali]|uniref:flagellar hook protein FlgE n=1 Tax=Vreelandella jeotgali TaxID=553386 RepID=UPI0003480D03|nr:flagellar hook protein FlgE [Halomonas jeotgali]